MEGAITPVLTILDERMKNMEIGEGVKNNRENETPYPDIISMEKNGYFD